MRRAKALLSTGAAIAVPLGLSAASAIAQQSQPNILVNMGGLREKVVQAIASAKGASE